MIKLCFFKEESLILNKVINICYVSEVVNVQIKVMKVFMSEVEGVNVFCMRFNRRSKYKVVF